MCQWICCCFYPKEDKKVKKKPKKDKKGKEKMDKMDKMKAQNDKNQESDQKTGEKTVGWAQEIESFYDTKDRKSVSDLEANTTPSEMCESDLTHTYFLPTENCKTTRELMTHFGFELQTQVGKGGFGLVRKCYHINPSNGQKKVLACKEIVLKQKEKMTKALKSEIFILKKCKHPYIIGLEDHFIVNDGSKATAFLFMEFADCDTLQLEINNGPIPNNLGKHYFSQMATALAYLHRLKIAHKDLKPENILLVSNEKTGLKDVRVGDFGLSQNVYKHKEGVIKTGHFGGTRGYMAPEILRLDVYKEHRKVLALSFDPFRSDMWALGVCLFEMLTKNLPFEYHNLNAMLALEEEKTFTYPKGIKETIDPKADDLIHQLLEPDVAKRIDPLGVLTHPWIRDEVDMSLIKVHD